MKSKTDHTAKGRWASYPSLAGRSVFVTGGGSGIGAEIVAAFAACDARVAFVDLAEAPSRALTASLAAAGYPEPLFLKADVTDIDALTAAIGTAAERHGPVTVLVNNAASDDRHEITDLTPDYWRQRMAVNLDHHVFAAKAVHPGMKAAGGGSIINMGSIAWAVGHPEMPAYVAAKAAILGLTKGLARAFGPADIRVNCVMPGAILTDRQKTLWMTPEYEREILDRQCLKRHLMPDEVARFVLFLAADDSSAMTGQGYVIDGGWL